MTILRCESYKFLFVRIDARILNNDWNQVLYIFLINIFKRRSDSLITKWEFQSGTKKLSVRKIYWKVSMGTMNVLRRNSLHSHIHLRRGFYELYRCKFIKKLHKSGWVYWSIVSTQSSPNREKLFFFLNS